MKNNITEVVFILDKSGSMSGLESDTVGGFNSMLAKQRKEEGEAFVTTVLFSDTCVTVHDRESIGAVKNMTPDDYFPAGCTALLDAMGDTVKHIETVHRYIRKEDVPQKTLFVIITDGMENASRRFSKEDVKAMILQKEELGWEFIFLGANMDAVQTAANYGIRAEHSVTYCCDSVGTQTNFDVVSDVISCARCSAPMPSNWKERIERHAKGKKM